MRTTGLQHVVQREHPGWVARRRLRDERPKDGPPVGFRTLEHLAKVDELDGRSYTLSADRRRSSGMADVPLEERLTHLAGALRNAWEAAAFLEDHAGEDVTPFAEQLAEMRDRLRAIRNLIDQLGGESAT